MVITLVQLQLYARRLLLTPDVPGSHDGGYAHAITRRAQKNRNDYYYHSRTGPHTATQVTSSRRIHQMSWRAPLGPRIVCNYATNVTI